MIESGDRALCVYNAGDRRKVGFTGCTAPEAKNKSYWVIEAFCAVK